MKKQSSRGPKYRKGMMVEAWRGPCKGVTFTIHILIKFPGGWVYYPESGQFGVREGHLKGV